MAFRESPTVERGRERLVNWALWARLDSSDTGYPSRCAYWVPPRRGDIDLEPNLDTADEPLPIIDWTDAELVEVLIVDMGILMQRAIKARYFERRAISGVARVLRTGWREALKILIEAEAIIGRS